jgi:cysteine-rich repeat protein
LGELGYDGCSGDCGSISSSSVSILDSSSLSAGSDVGLIVGKLWGDATVTNTYGTVYDSQYGNITFLTWNVTSASGGNLTQQIYLNNNSAYVNGSNSGLNKSANITLIGLPTNFTNPIILKDGVACGSANYNFTSLNAGTVVFNVSSWSNYSIGEGSLYCGDALIQCFETCDDNNLNNLDGCSSTCSVETGYTCSGTPSICARCGDGLIKGSEVCDDNNLNNLDGCSSTCSVETGYTCSGTPSVCTTICGDGLIKGSEVCDDNNLNNLDGCSSTCSVETGYTCSGTPSICARCGDGNCTNGIETCSSCPTDCGSCPSSGGSSSGGGGGGGSRKTYQCNDKKDNDNDGLIDLNDPGCTDKNDDDEYNYICKEKWVCTNWEPAVCPAEQTQTRTCEDVNRCGTQAYKEPTVKYCKHNEPVQDVQEAKQTTQEQPQQIKTSSQKAKGWFLYVFVGTILIIAMLGIGYVFYPQISDIFQPKSMADFRQQPTQKIFSQQREIQTQQLSFNPASVKRLEIYARKMMSEGYPRDKIREAILKVGWKQDIVDYVFARIK